MDQYIFLDKCIHQYVFLKFLGQGGYSKVFLVYSKKFQTQFVAKVISLKTDPVASNDIYTREIESLKLLDHPNIIRLYDYFQQDGFGFLIIEYCPNGTLKDLIRNHYPLSHEICVSITHQLFDALIYMHSHNISHHDIKPSNILFDKYGRPKFSDFGLARIGEAISDNYQCSFLYAPPEILLQQEYDPKKADIWSLGVTLLEMCNGNVPWIGNDRMSIKNSILLSNLQVLKCPFPDFLALSLRMVCPLSKRISSKKLSSYVFPEGNNFKNEHQKILKLFNFNQELPFLTEKSIKAHESYPTIQPQSMLQIDPISLSQIRQLRRHSSEKKNLKHFIAQKIIFSK